MPAGPSNARIPMSIENNTGFRTCAVDPVGDPRWAALVARAPNATIFSHPLWLALVGDCYDYPMTAICVVSSEDELLAGLPLATVSSPITGTRLVSVPFSDSCGMLMLSPDLEPSLVAAVDVERRRRGLKLEVHGELPSLPDSAPSERFYHHLVPLDGEADDVVRQRVKPTKRRCASRARRLGVTARRRYDAAALDAFFGLHVLTRRRLGVPTQPRRFFNGLLPMFDDGLGFVLLLEWEGRTIGAGIYLRHGSRLTYKYGASDPSHLDKRPNDLMHMEALRIACESRCSVLDLGRTELDNDGLRRFKRDFGAEEHALTYTTAPPGGGEKSVRSVSHMQRTLIRRLPPAFGRLVGAAVYRHFG